ncbi:unnamed protein product [Nesidiocoris tenuis]|uniref:Uncharacterized protein n=1 Tax=Nesidiocoris tenuis TaxID=355587 RepID=A0A6H5HS33_9HEMI|nr:unnamed protein product [Nesidiocoris tenuis]
MTLRGLTRHNSKINVIPYPTSSLRISEPLLSPLQAERFFRKDQFSSVAVLRRVRFQRRNPKDFYFYCQFMTRRSQSCLLILNSSVSHLGCEQRAAFAPRPIYWRCAPRQRVTTRRYLFNVLIPTLSYNGAVYRFNLFSGEKQQSVYRVVHRLSKGPIADWDNRTEGDFMSQRVAVYRTMIVSAVRLERHVLRAAWHARDNFSCTPGTARQSGHAYTIL